MQIIPLKDLIKISGGAVNDYCQHKIEGLMQNTHKVNPNSFTPDPRDVALNALIAQNACQGLSIKDFNDSLSAAYNAYYERLKK